MGIDPADLARFSPWAQKQIAEKMLEQERERAKRRDSSTPLRSAQNGTGNRRKHAGEHGEKESKYRNIPDTRNGAEGKIIKFKSRKEARRYDELMLMLKAGKIRDLRLQEEFTLIEAYTTPDGKRVRAERYRSDFSYWRNGEKVVEDVKGGNATKTRVYAVKKKQMQDKYGITITEL